MKRTFNFAVTKKARRTVQRRKAIEFMLTLFLARLFLGAPLRKSKDEPVDKV